MSPELLDPESFGLTESRPTKSSDCYALGMVMYEVLSGHHPFFPRSGPIIMVDILDGKRPRRPEGGERNPFTDDIWAMLELCWKHQPSTRTSVKAVLSFLGDTSLLGMSGSEADGDVVTDTGNESDDTTYNSCGFLLSHPKSRAHLRLMEYQVRQSSTVVIFPSNAMIGVTFMPFYAPLFFCALPQLGFFVALFCFLSSFWFSSPSFSVNYRRRWPYFLFAICSDGGNLTSLSEANTLSKNISSFL